VEGWEHFLPGEMKILHEGNIVFSRRPGLHEGHGAAKAPPDAVRVAPIAAESQVVLDGGKAAAKA
jgi:hypothetical protein